MTDGDLVRQTLAGDTAAYEELVCRWSARVMASCHARVGRGHAAEDLAQETLLRGLRALKSLDDPDKFGPWLRGIAARVCCDWLKAKERRHLPLGGPAGGNHAEELADVSTLGEPEADRDEVDRLMAEVQALPEEYREVVLLYYYQDVTYRDLAELLGVSSATINARLTKARARLRERMSDPRRV